MKIVIRCTIVLLALAGAVSLSAQTADEVVAKHIAAIGGKETLSQIKSISTESSIQIMGNDAPNTTQLLDGVGYKSETDFNGTKIIQCYNGKGGWSVNPMAGAGDPTPMADDEYNAGKGQINVGGALYNFAAKGSKVELVGKDADTYKVKLTSKENIESAYVIDAKTYFIKSVTTKGKMQGQDVDVTTSFSDYRKTELGYFVPYAIDLDIGGQFSMTIALRKIEFNKTIDPAVFEIPKPTPAGQPAS